MSRYTLKPKNKVTIRYNKRQKEKLFFPLMQFSEFPVFMSQLRKELEKTQTARQ